MDWPTGHAFATALVTGLLLGGLFTVTALGLSLVFGVMRLINLVHGELLVLGAFLAFELGKHGGLDPPARPRRDRAGMFLLGYPLQRILLGPADEQGGRGAADDDLRPVDHRP